MHSLWRHKNQTWYVLYGPRQRRQISTQTKDRGQAEQFLARFIATADEPTTGLPTFGQILDAYYADKAGTVRSPGSMFYGIKGLQPLKDLYPSQLTPTAIRSWAAQRGAGAGTILREVGIARAALEWGVEHKWCVREQVPPISNPVPTPRPRDRWLTKTEARALLLGIQEAHIRVFVMLGLHTLARTGAILEARWTQVNLERRTIDYGAGHGNKRRVIAPLNDELFPVLEAARRLSCSTYVVEWRGGAVQSIRNGFDAAVRRAGLTDDVTPHILRHSGASWMVEAGVPDGEVARMLGDTEEMVRRVYGHFSPNYLKRASSALKLGTEAEHPP
jgi:integrase